MGGQEFTCLFLTIWQLWLSKNVAQRKLKYLLCLHSIDKKQSGVYKFSRDAKLQAF